jgi:hypothetical protein
MKRAVFMMRYRALEAGGFGKMPRSVRRQVHLQRGRETGLTANPPPPALYAARDRKLIGMLTGGGGGWQGGAAAGFLMKNRQNVSFLRSCQKFKKTRKTFLQELVFKKKLSYLIGFPAI